MKKTTSFHLEQSTIDEIEAYKNKFGLSSRNEALEKMLVERRIILAFQTGEASSYITSQKEVEKEKLNISEDDNLKKSIENNFNNMPD